MGGMGIQARPHCLFLTLSLKTSLKGMASVLVLL
jgi:hypothetical protein